MAADMVITDLDLTAAPGAYALLVDLDRKLSLAETSLGTLWLPPSRYLYCGSAYGPGGLGARLRRHLRRDKTARWHVDRLTLGGRIVGLGLVPGGEECALVAQLICDEGIEIPVPGFGSSDCKRCPAHLLRITVNIDPWAISEEMQVFEIGRGPASVRRRSKGRWRCPGRPVPG